MRGERENHGMLDGLEDMGLNAVEGASLYHDDESQKQSVQVKGKTEAEYLFDSKVQCPVCDNGIAVRKIRRSALRLQSKDTDSMPVYQDINPLFYDIWLCGNCGYAASESAFSRPLSNREVQLIQKNISSRFRAREYPALYDADIAIERFKLALLSATVRKAKAVDIAMLCLKMGWVYRTKDDSENELKCLAQAANGFKTVYSEGPFPAAGMNESALAFLIGELLRRVGNYKEALDYFGKVLMDRAAKSALKERAYDQRQMIIKATRSDPDPTADAPPTSTASAPRGKGLKNLFRR